MRAKHLFPLLCLTLGCLTACIPPLPDTIAAQRNLEYAQVDGHSLRLDLYELKKTSGKQPVVVWIHGGAWTSGDKDFCPIAYMAEQNLAIVSIDYRLSQVAPFPAQIYDCKGAIRWLRAHADAYNLDADHIGIFGASAGGHLAALLGTTANMPSLEGDVGGNTSYSSRVQCVCAFYPPTDIDKLVNVESLRNATTTDVAHLLGGSVNSNPDKVRAASPITYVTKDAAPFYLLHGGADTLVPPSQSQLFYDALIKVGVPAQLAIIPNKGHGIIAPPEQAKEIYAFYQKYLGNKPPPDGK